MSETNLIENLRSFNAKERFFLVGQILGNENFTLVEDFRKNLGEAFKPTLNIPENAFVAMDYHLDWVYASLIQTEGSNKKVHENPSQKFIAGNQENADLLIAFEDKEKKTQLIFIEAKGVGSWSPKQLESKRVRYENIFGKDKTQGKFDSICDYQFLLMSPAEPENLHSIEICSKKAIWMALPITQPLKKVVRCDEDKKPNKEGEWFRITNRNIRNSNDQDVG